MDNLEVETVQETEQQNEKPYTLRPLRDDDLYPILAIIGKVFPEELSAAFVQIATKEKTLKQVGYDVGFRLFTAVIKNLHTVDAEVYEMLSNLSGIPAEEIRKMKFGTTPKMIWEVYNEVKNQDFFGDASKSS